MKKVKYVLTTVLLLIIVDAGYCQSPYYSIKISLPADLSINPYRYDIQYNLCLPDVYSTRGDWFDHDTSALDTKSLPGDYLKGLECRELGSESNEIFSYGNQMMAYESIGNATITRTRNTHTDTMQIVFLITRKSFVTFIDLEKLEFMPGLYDITSGLVYDYGHHMKISLKDGYEWSKVEESVLWRE